MPNISNGNTKQKKSKITLDRILSIKRSIMETLNLFKHDKPPSQIQENHAVSKGQGKVTYRKCPKNDADTSNTPQIPYENSNQANDTVSNTREHSNAAFQRNQTWPHDEYSSQTFQDKSSAKTQIHKQAQTAQVKILEQYRIQKEQISSPAHKNSTVRSVKNQEIQTDEEEIPNVNADIIMYLNQFNDKVAFEMIGPARFRNSNGFSSGYYEHDYYWQNDPSSYYESQANRRVPRIRDLGDHNFMQWPQYDHLKLASFEPKRQYGFHMPHEPQRQYGFGMPNEPQRQHGFEMSIESQRRNGFEISNDTQRRYGFDTSNDPQRQNGFGISNDPQRQNGFGISNDPQRQFYFGMSNELQNHVFGLPREPQRHHVFRLPNEPQRYYKFGWQNEPQRQPWSGMLNESPKQNGLSSSKDLPQRHRGHENPQIAPVNPSEVGSSVQASSRAVTRASSGDSGSILSSETDSDFIFYPCSSLTQAFQRVTLLDSRNTSFLSPPLDLPENISTNFSWRSDFYGSSLDEVTLQFFLDDDALSDDVFVDDHELIYSLNNAARDHIEPYQYATGAIPAAGNSQVYGRSHQMDSDLKTESEARESYSDNCYAYRYADIDEVLNSYIESPPEAEHVGINKENGNILSSVENPEEFIPLTSDPESQCNYDDSYLAPSHDLSNVFDSLRRNSTQTKARKMWRQRRAKCKKNLAHTSNSGTKVEHQRSTCQPTTFTFDPISVHNPSHSKPPPKPLRGILKNKDSKTARWQSELQSNQVRDAQRSADAQNNTVDVITLGTDSKCHSNSSYIYACVQKQVNPNIPSIDETVNDCIESALDKLPLDIPPHLKDDNEINSAGTEVKTLNKFAENKHKYEEKEDTANTQKISFLEERHTQETSSKINEQFHFILSSDTTGNTKIMAVRKNSLEAYEWARSLKRRQGRLAKKAQSNRNEDTVKDKCGFMQHRILATSAATI